MTISAGFSYLKNEFKSALIKLVSITGSEGEGWSGKFAVYKTQKAYTSGNDPVATLTFGVDNVEGEDPAVTLYNGLKATGLLKSFKDL